MSDPKRQSRVTDLSYALPLPAELGPGPRWQLDEPSWRRWGLSLFLVGMLLPLFLGPSMGIPWAGSGSPDWIYGLLTTCVAWLTFQSWIRPIRWVLDSGTGEVALWLGPRRKRAWGRREIVSLQVVEGIQARSENGIPHRIHLQPREGRAYAVLQGTDWEALCAAAKKLKASRAWAVED